MEINSGDKAAEYETHDRIMRENRLGREMSEIAREYPEVYFNYSGFGDPWTDLFGVFKDDPYFDEWQQAIREYRERCDRDDDAVYTTPMAGVA